MTQFFSDIGDSIYNFFSAIYTFFFGGGLLDLIYGAFNYLYEQLLKLTMIISIKVLEAAISAVQSLAQTQNYSAGVEGYWSAIDTDIQNLLIYFHLPLILTMYIGAYITRRLLKFVGF
ncbi:MAG: hypothetical protein HQL69_19360 [Magnetococcales bacterium]|nr:hypothetical protein [Magnetococcales bacterium]